MVEKREDGWWFRDDDNPDPYFRDVGPYQTKKDAEEGRRGVINFWKQRKKEVSDDRSRNRSR